MKKTNYLQQLIIVISILQCSLTSCHSFYKATSTNLKNNSEKTEVVEKLKMENKIFVLRNGTDAFEMNNIIINNEKNTLECTLDSLSDLHKLHLTKGKRGNMQYIKHLPEHLSVLNEVHVYIVPGLNATEGKYTLDLDKIQKLEIIEKDKGRTAESHVLGGLAYSIGILAIVSLVYVASGGLEWDWNN